jgi:putative membrane protein
MNYRLLVLAAGVALPALFSFTARAANPEPFSAQDKLFVAKVSQGGMFEVALGKLAETMASTQDIRDSGDTEAHDHALVGAKLKTIVEANDMSFPSDLNAMFQDRLDRVKFLTGARFDAAYLAEMKKIHEADGAAFAKESRKGSNPALRAFAAETYRIVQRHLGELNASVK